MSKSKTKLSHAAGLKLIEDGVITQEVFDAAVVDGHIADLRVPGGRSRFVSKDQEDFYDAKMAMLEAVETTIAKVPEFKTFMAEYSKSFTVDNEPVEIGVKFQMKNFQRCFNSFVADEEEEN